VGAILLVSRVTINSAVVVAEQMGGTSGTGSTRLMVIQLAWLDVVVVGGRGRNRVC
jgi:hypothetical protein